MTASEVAMNSALPDAPAGPEADDGADRAATTRPARANTTIRTRPAISVHLAPIRLDTQLVISIATAVTTR